MDLIAPVICERLHSILLVNIIAAIFDCYGSGRQGRKIICTKGVSHGQKKREREREERGCGSEVSSTSLPPTPSTPALILSTATLPSPPHPFHSNTVHSNSISIMAFWIYSRKLARPMRPKKTPA